MAAITNLLPLGGWLAAFERWARPKLNYALTRWVFLPKLKSESPQIRSYAAEALAEFGSEQALQPLIELLGDMDSTVRRFSISALGHLRDVRAIEPLHADLPCHVHMYDVIA